MCKIFAKLFVTLSMLTVLLLGDVSHMALADSQNVNQPVFTAESKIAGLRTS